MYPYSFYGCVAFNLNLQIFHFTLLQLYILQVCILHGVS